MRMILDILFLAIAWMIAEAASQVVLFSLLFNIFDDVHFFSSDSGWTHLLDVCFFLLVFSAEVFLYRMFIKKVWPSIMLSVLSQITFIIIALITTIVLTLNFFISLNENLYYSALFNLFIQIIYFSLLFVLSSVLLFTLNRANKIKQKEIEYKQLQQYLAELEKVNGSMKSFKHDYQNILLTMHGYMNENNFDGLKDYFYERIATFEKKSIENHYAFSQLNNIKQVELKGLLSSKILFAAESDIPIHIEIPEMIEKVEMDIIDLTRIIGIIIDNAVDEVQTSKNQQINLALLKKENGSILLILENEIMDDTINIHTIFQKGYSTKDENRGDGLSIVRDIIHQHQNVTMNTRIENHLFIHEMVIHPLEKKKHSFHFFKRKLA